MKKLLLIPALLAGSLALAEQKKFEISPMIGYDFADSGIKVKDDAYPVGGIEVQFNSADSKWSPEFSLLYSQGVDYSSENTLTGEDTRVVRGAFNGVYTFNEAFSLVPFAKVGAGYESVSNDSPTLNDGFFLDAGAGAKFPFTENLALKLEAIYMAKLSSDNDGTMDTNLVTMVGLTFAFGATEQKAPPAPVVEEVEEVVAVAAVPVAIAVVDGDDDNDGVLNSLDKCPVTVAGAKVDAEGCNIDNDNDGVINSADHCLETPAGTVVDAKGCEEDKDKDGVLNAQDICPNTVAGEAVNSDGCPASVILNINFKTNSDAINPATFSQLDEYEAFLKKHTNYSAKIIGYTDSLGSAAYNQKLSQKRANAVVTYLVNKGVNPNQLTALGKGESDPIADNTTADGRAQNRRIEAELTRH